MRALVLVDLQNDFLPGGALAVPHGDEVISVVNKLLDKKFDCIVATKDWHPKDHGSFDATHRKKAGERIDLYGLEQILWPVHCVQNTKGADFGPGWDVTKVEKIFFKGTEPNIDSYSTFFDNGHRKSTGLDDYLRAKKVEDVYIMGLTTDYCIRFSVLDALKLGFNVYVVQDGCRAVNLEKGDEERALQEMKRAGAHMITSDQVA